MVNQILTYVFGGAAAVMLLWGYLRRSRRVALWFGAGCAGAAAGAAAADAFWPMVLLGVLALCGFIMALNVIDLSWRARFGIVLGAVLVGLLSLWPTLERMTDGRLPCPAYVEDHVNFRLVAGLDLRGGLRLVYTVDVDEAIKDKRDRYYEDMRVELAKIFGLHQGDQRPSEEVYKKLREKVELVAPRQSANSIDLTVKPGSDPSKVDVRFRELFGGDLTFSRSADGRHYAFRIKESAETSIRERAVSQAREIILRRVDALGLREAAVSTRDEDIIVEVPGEDEKSFAAIRDIISQTARLEFKMVDDDTDFFGPLAQRASEQSLPEGLDFRNENAPVGLDPAGDVRTKQSTFAFLSKKPGETGQATLQRLKEWVATLELPPDRELGYELEYVTDPDTLKESEAGWRSYLLKSRADISGDMIRDAAAVPDQGQSALGGWHVALTFTDQGGSIFERITGENIKRRFAIILDDRIESAPVIQSRIPGGYASITLGSSDPEIQLRDARKLELVLRSGALPAPISPSNEQRIGPSLGRDSIRLGVEGAAAGVGLVLLFMIFYYRGAGLIADISVITNVLLQLAVLCTFDASMTLPGIAGIALTVGMGVDANVLFNERIREELAAGKSPRAAVDLGFNRALSAIIDGQVTTAIAGIVLAQYGSGPIKGFAITLIVGVIVNIFTSIVFSRVMFDLWIRGGGRRTTLSLG